jgi:hypothetical protein
MMFRDMVGLCRQNMSFRAAMDQNTAFNEGEKESLRWQLIFEFVFIETATTFT